MKLLHSHIISGIAGSEGYLLNILPELKRRGNNVEFLCLYKKGEIEQTQKFCSILEKHDIPSFKVEIPKIPLLGTFRKINAIIKKGSYDIVHSHLLHADLLISTTKYLFRQKFKLVSTKHGYEEWYNNQYGFDPSHKVKNRYWRLARFAEKMTTRSYAISNGLYNLYSGLGICPKEKFDLIYYGFDFDDSYSHNEEFRFGSPQLAIVGRLTGFKGHRYAFGAIKILKEKYPDIRLVVIGSGELEQELMQLTIELGISENVVFTGFQPNPRDYVFTSDLALLPSISEGFGLVVLEAMSVKKALITFDVPSPNELLVHKETGWLVEPYNVSEYAKAIDHLMEDKSLRETIASNAYSRLKDYYNLTRMVDETEAFYAKVIAHT